MKSVAGSNCEIMGASWNLWKKHLKKMIFLVVACACVILSACQTDQNEEPVQEESEPAPIVVGFSQLGAESDWRNMHTQSMKTVFTEKNGYKLIFEDGQQKQSNQIKAIRRFIQQEVDYIVLAPVQENGWDTVLEEAKEAGIPVILVDRAVAVSDESLFSCWVGSDFVLEGRKVCGWLEQYLRMEEIPAEEVRIVNLQGTIGASAQIGRTKALREAARKNGWQLLAEADGDFTQMKAKESMKKLLREYEDINIVYCENDNEAFGAIEALEEAGKKVGMDLKGGEVMILSFDGVNEGAVELVREKKIACLAECNPVHGNRVRTILETLKRGEVPEKYEYVEEGIYSAFPGIQEVEVGDECYTVTILNGVTGETF